MSGKFGLVSGKCQGILFCQVCMNPVFCKQRAMTPEGMVGYGPFTNLKKSSWY